MKKKSLKFRTKKNQRIKTLVLASGLLICCCLVFALLFTITSWNNEIYRIDSRITELKKEKKLDTTDYRTIGWLRVQGTNIDAPIIGYNNVEVFNTINKENYLWNNINEEKLYNQVSISGHNILNLSSNPQIGLEYFSRFDDLMGFVYLDFIAENKYIQYTVNGEDYIYKIFSVFFEKDYNLDLNHKGNYSKEEMKAYLKKTSDSSIYDFDIQVNENDSIITLTTCTRFFGLENKEQFVVVGRLLRENEKMKNYEVTINNNYKEIEKIMKGDDNNEETQEV